MCQREHVHMLALYHVVNFEFAGWRPPWVVKITVTVYVFVLFTLLDSFNGEFVQYETYISYNCVSLYPMAMSLESKGYVKRLLKYMSCLK